MIPYMGSKRKLAPKILDCILEQNPNTKYFYDLFGGGGAVSIEAMKRGLTVFYNEIDLGVVNLLKKIRDDGVTPEFYEWVDRETFNEMKNGSCWKSGLIKTCWSFGNNQRTYLFSKQIDDLKKEATEFLLKNGYNGEKEKRIKLIKEFKEMQKIEGRFDLENLQRLQNLERLERLENLDLKSLNISNLSYEEVNIDTPTENTIIYCDIPYKGTGKYQNGIDYDKFYDWVKRSPYKIYVSSYDSELKEVASWEHRSTLSATNNSRKVSEKLFCNKEQQ